MTAQHTVRHLIHLDGIMPAAESPAPEVAEASLSLANKTALVAALLVIAWFAVGLAAGLYTWLAE